MNSTFRSLLFWIVIFGVVLLLWQAIQGGSGDSRELTFSEFLTKVEGREVREVTIKERELEGKLTGSQTPEEKPDFTAEFPEWDGLVPLLIDSGVTIKSKKETESPLLAIFLTWGPVLLIVGLWIFFMRQFQSGGNKAMSFGKSKAKLLNTGGKKVTFDDVAGVDEAKAELAEVVDFLKEAE